MFTTIYKRTILILTVLSLCMWMPLSAQAQEAVQVNATASSAVLYEPTTGTVLFEKNAHVKRPMASTTKLMTALLAAECLPLEREITVSADAVQVIGTSMGLAAGDRATVRDLLYGLLLASGNDAANVLAQAVDGSLTAFSERMNARATALGMTDSHFVTPSGLDADGHGASAYDMALLAAEVLKNETLSAICASPSAVVTVSGREISLRNHNRLLSMVEGCVGMKTGYTTQSGRCLVSAAIRDGVTLIAVTLDCADDWEEHRVLLEEGFALLEHATLPLPSLEAVTVFGGTAPAVAVTAQPPSVTRLRAAEPPSATVNRVPYVWAPVQAGDVLGTVEYRVNGVLTATAPLLAASSVGEVPRASLWTRMGSMFLKLLQAMLSQ